MISTDTMGTPVPQPTPKRKKPARWTSQLAKQFCTVSSYFLQNYHRLGDEHGHRGLNSVEAMLVIHVLDFKWDERLPFPTVGTLARRMGVSARHVRDTLKTLEERGYVRRVARAPGGANQYDVSGLYTALEHLMELDVAKNETNTSEAA